MKSGERLHIASRWVLLASRGIAWTAVWVTVAVLLIWLAVPVAIGLREWDYWAEHREMLLYLLFPAGCIILPGTLFHFLPLYCADVFLWGGVKRALEVEEEEHRAFWLTVCVVGILISTGVVVLYARQAVLWEIREFFA